MESSQWNSPNGSTCWVIGIDGGGTSTQAGIFSTTLGKKLPTIDRAKVHGFETGATNYHNVGIEVAKKRFKEILDHYDHLNTQIAAVCLGGAGVDSQLDKEIVENMFRDLGYHGRLTVVNDSVTALVGGNRGATGGIVIAGTGSIAYGMGKEKHVRVGGWGNLLGDEGSGYDLGCRAFKHVMACYDGRTSPKKQSRLWHHLRDHLSFSSEEDILQYVYGPQATKSDIAAVAPLVIDLYGKCEDATWIVDQGIEGLCEMVQALATRLEQQSFPLTVGGSLLVKSEVYQRLFAEALKKRLPLVEVHPPQEGPVEGAIRLALTSLEGE